MYRVSKNAFEHMSNHKFIHVTTIKHTEFLKYEKPVPKYQLVDIVVCCNLSVGVALNVRFTTSGMCAKNTIYMWREQAIIE